MIKGMIVPVSVGLVLVGLLAFILDWRYRDIHLVSASLVLAGLSAISGVMVATWAALI